MIHLLAGYCTLGYGEMMSDLFGEQFYPTPTDVVKRMIAGLSLAGKSVIDMQAGDGAILDVVNEIYLAREYGQKSLTYAIEIDSSLRAILAEKGHRVIESDCFAYRGNRRFDFILGNPPFAAGVEHLLWMWQMANGATIRCLLNWQSLVGWEQPQLALTRVSKNQHKVEGWKTNKAYFVPNKFILPNCGKGYGPGLSWSRASEIQDIERALCLLDGRKFEDIISVAHLYDGSSSYGEKVRSTFFKTQFYMRGTIHFWWLDPDLRDRFNAVVAQRWGWLPEKISKGIFD